MNNEDKIQQVDEEQCTARKCAPARNVIRLIAAATIGVAAPLILLTVYLLCFGSDWNMGIVLLLMIALFVTGIILAASYFFKENDCGITAKVVICRRLPLFALLLDFSAVGFLFAALSFAWEPLLMVLFLIHAVISPIAAISAGTIALCLGPKKIGKSGIALSLAAILIPVIFIIIFGVLPGWGVMLIRFM